MKYRIAKGVFDILPKDPHPDGEWRNSYYWDHLESLIRHLAKLYGFQEIRTPLFETTELFQRSIGSTSDIVKKEMYTFHDKGNRSLTLRPEGTAPVMRAFIEKSLHQHGGLHKFFYLYSMFRYERQQAGRYRQHHQFGVEAIGTASPYQEVEVIELLYILLKRLGLKGLTLHLNSIGSSETRKNYTHALKSYLKPHFNALSADSQERYDVNPLRILDSKNPIDKKLLEKAPSIIEFLSKEETAHFNTVCSLLEANGIPYVLNSKLVRGLDYYNHTVFEITAEELGAQNALGGGGRYDGLLQTLGGPDLPAIGFGMGLERVIQTMLKQQVPMPPSPAPFLYFIPMGVEAEKICFHLLSEVRAHDLTSEMDFSGKKLKNALRTADSKGAHFVAILGEDELKKERVSLKEMATGKTEEVSFDQLTKSVKHALSSHT